MRTTKTIFAMLIWIALAATISKEPVHFVLTLGALFIIGDYIYTEIKTGKQGTT